MLPETMAEARVAAPLVIIIPEITDLAPGSSRVISSSIGDIAVFRTSDGELFAVLDQCPHRKGPLSQGLVCGHTVICPLHNWCIDLASGSVLGVDEGNVRSFRVRTEANHWVLSDD